MATWHWFLSFRDPEANKNLGGCMVVTEDSDPPSAQKAAEKAWDEGCNPGGEVLGFTAEGSEENISEAIIAMPENVLLTKSEVADLWAPFGLTVSKKQAQAKTASGSLLEATTLINSVLKRINTIYWEQGGIEGAKRNHGFDEEELSTWSDQLSAAIEVIDAARFSSKTQVG